LIAEVAKSSNNYCFSIF